MWCLRVTRGWRLFESSTRQGIVLTTLLLFSSLTGRALINFFRAGAALNGEGTALIWIRYITLGEAGKQHFLWCIVLRCTVRVIMWVRLTIHLKAIVSSTFRLYVILRYKKPFQLLTSTSWWKSDVTAEKRALKKSKTACLKVSCWKQNEYIAPQGRKILKLPPTWTPPPPPPPHKKLATLKSCIFIRFGRITFKLGNFLNVKTLFRRCRRFRPNDPHIENLKFRSGTLPWYWLWCCLKRLYNLSKGYCEVLYCGSVYFCCQHCF